MFRVFTKAIAVGLLCSFCAFTATSLIPTFNASEIPGQSGWVANYPTGPTSDFDGSPNVDPDVLALLIQLFATQNFAAADEVLNMFEDDDFRNSLIEFCVRQEVFQTGSRPKVLSDPNGTFQPLPSNPRETKDDPSVQLLRYCLKIENPRSRARSLLAVALLHENNSCILYSAFEALKHYPTAWAEREIDKEGALDSAYRPVDDVASPVADSSRNFQISFVAGVFGTLLFVLGNFFLTPVQNLGAFYVPMLFRYLGWNRVANAAGGKTSDTAPDIEPPVAALRNNGV